MAEFGNQISIAASPTQIWSILSDFENWPDWADSFTSIQLLDSGPVGIGSQVRIKQPRLAPGNWTITEWMPGKSFAWISKSPGIESFANHWILNEGTSCTFQQTMTIRGFLGQPVAFLMKGLVRRYMDMEAAGLKKRAEQCDQVASPE